MPKNSMKERIIQWLMKETAAPRSTLSDFDRLRHVIHPCDVLLVEGRSRVGRYIRRFTASPWTHAALYIGHVQDIDDPILREHLIKHCSEEIKEDPLVIESVLGQGTIVSSIKKYSEYHLRIARPAGISHQGAQQVISHVIQRIGSSYDISNIFELARLFAPWWLAPFLYRKRVLGVLPSNTNKEICSSAIAEAFQSIQFPILPLLNGEKENELKLTPIHPRLFAPCDFDFSPFFEIVKYPIIGMGYTSLPWTESGAYQYHR